MGQGTVLGVTGSRRSVLNQIGGSVEPFANLAARVVETLPRNPERTVGKLLEAMDCAVRAASHQG